MWFAVPVFCLLKTRSLKIVFFGMSMHDYVMFVHTCIHAHVFNYVQGNSFFHTAL